MLDFIRFTGIIFISGSIAWACSGTGGTQGSNYHGGASGSGSGGVLAGSGGGASGAGDVHGGSAGTGSSAGGSGGSSSGAGASGAAGSNAGSAGAGGASISALGCAKDDDCIVAYGHGNKGCCFRGCGSAYNRDYVANEPCVAAGPSDPAPVSCDTGCIPCPASQCPAVYGATCFTGQCTSVTQYGPCATDDDCVVAVDYASQQGGCCSCPEITTKLVLANNRCIVLKGQPKPDGCAPTPAGICNSLGCPAQCANPTMLQCDKGMCKGS